MDVAGAFETPPASPTPRGDFTMSEIASIKRAVASNAREIRKNRSGIQRSKDNARIAGAVNAYMKKAPRSSNKRAYSFKSTPRASSRRRY